MSILSDGEHRPYASVTTRGLAWLVDIVLSAVFGVVFGSLFALVDESFGVLMFVLGMGAYYVVSEAVWGQTPGKRVVGIRVVSTHGDDLSVGASVLRNVTKLVGGASLLCILVGVVLIADSRDNQRLGDRLGGTIVVRD